MPEFDDQNDAAERYSEDVRSLINTSGHWLDFMVEYEFPEDVPPDRLVRFLSIEQYVSLLTSQRLYFPQAAEYEDPYECSFPPTFCEDLIRQLIETCDEPEFSLPGDVDPGPYIDECEVLLEEKVMREFGSSEADRWFMTCWHAGDAATDLMWRSYGGNRGVALTCDGPALLELLSGTVTAKRSVYGDEGKFDFVHGFVNYEPEALLGAITDVDSTPVVAVRVPAFRKHHYFRLDAEYRFAVRLLDEEVSFYRVSSSLPLDACATTVSVSPLCPQWIADAIRRLTLTYYPEIDFERLTLD